MTKERLTVESVVSMLPRPITPIYCFYFGGEADKKLRYEISLVANGYKQNDEIEKNILQLGRIYKKLHKNG